MTRPAHRLIFAGNKSSREWRTVRYCLKKTQSSCSLRARCWIKSTSSGKIRHFLIPEFIFSSHYLFAACVCWAGLTIRGWWTALSCKEEPSKAGLRYCLGVTPREQQNFGVLLDRLDPKWRTRYKLCNRGLEGPCLICPISYKFSLSIFYLSLLELG